MEVKELGMSGESAKGSSIPEQCGENNTVNGEDSIEALAAQKLEERRQEDKEITDKLVEHPRCAIIPSPDKLDRSPTSEGQDETLTRKDFNIVWQWLTSSNFCNTGFYKDEKETVDRGGLLENTRFKKLIEIAFSIAFDAIRQTKDPDKEEMVLLYYSGHGFSIQNTTTANCSSSPVFSKLDFGKIKCKELYDARNLKALKDLNPEQRIKGGELLLHNAGFCDLRDLLAPFVAAVTKESDNAPGKVKQNKHLVVIADSCYSGVLVQDLQKLNKQRGPWNENRCSVTVQSACSKDEMTYGGYFTPCFVHFNQAGNEDLRQQLKQEWENKNGIEKNAYRELELPSPCVETTMLPEQLKLEDEAEPIMKLPCIQGFQLYLFRDPGFFKFCYLRFSKVTIPGVSPAKKSRVLGQDVARKFLEQKEFRIIDYKLMKMKRNGTPMALFLVESGSKESDPVICAHIHFNSASTEVTNVSTVTLVEHTRPKDPSALFLEIDDTKRTGICYHIAENLVALCKSYVDEKEDGRWEDVGRWNMKSGDLGVNNNFRLKERSVRMDKYVKEIVSENTV